MKKKRTLLSRNDGSFNEQNIYVNRQMKTPPPPNTNYNHPTNKNLKKNTKKLYNAVPNVNDKKESKMIQSLRKRKVSKEKT